MSDLVQYINERLQTVEKNKSNAECGMRFIEKGHWDFDEEVAKYAKQYTFAEGEIAGLKYALSLLPNQNNFNN